jgi:hypothetical protein
LFGTERLIAKAAHESGLRYSGAANAVMAACRRAGVESQHGRWRDFQNRAARIRQIDTDNPNLSISKLLEIIGQEEGKKIAPSWIYRHMPKFIEERNTRRAANDRDTTA